MEVTKPKRICIAGSRHYRYPGKVSLFVRTIPISHHVEIVTGGSGIVDETADKAAQGHFQRRIFHANWKLYGNAAGPLRNKDMAEYADELVAFWDGKSPGTRSCIREFQKRGKPVQIFTEEPREVQDEL